MLVFVIPLKSKKNSNSWSRVCQLFERCIRSVCNQTIPDFKVVVACHEKPQIDFSHPNIHYLEVEFSVKDNLNYVQKNTDKGRKILAGLVHAGQFNPSHTMVVDADDCVSQNLAQFVRQHPHAEGWFIDRGYKYKESDTRQFIYLKMHNFYHMCGTSNILRYDLNFLPPNPRYDLGYGSYKYYIDHARITEILKQKNIFLKPLPFAGAVYVLGHGENNTKNEKNLLFNWFNRRSLNDSITSEFGLYHLPQLSQAEKFNS